MPSRIAPSAPVPGGVPAPPRASSGCPAAILALAAIAAFPAAPLCAQGNPNAPTVTVSRLNDLAFGLVVGSAPVVVRPEDPAAARFEVRVRGRPSHAVTVTLALPPALLSGPDRLPVRFGATSAAWATPDSPDERTAFDPARGVTVTLDQRGPKSLLVWIGGTLEPSASQPSGTYAELITLSAVEN